MIYLKNLLGTVFSGDVGLSEKGIEDALRSIRSNPDARELSGIKGELQDMFENADTDWVSFLDNDECEVYYAESQDDALNYVIERIWNPLFPGQPR